MCGIAGEIRFDGGVGDAVRMRRMLVHLRRRGPDGHHVFTDGAVALAHTRLAIIDLSPAGEQPMVDEELGLVLVFNGVIYNYRELRSELSAFGYRFFSDSDSEVILKAYHRWGDDCPRRLDGIFAFAVWDRNARSLLLARDRLGIKPLYYTRDARRLAFASNPQALLAAGGVDTTLDPVALHHHLTLHAVVPAPRTLLRGVRKLEPAHSLRVDAVRPGGSTTKKRYWNLTPGRNGGDGGDGRDLGEAEWIERTRTELRRAVETRFRIADVPVGVLLSGGLDSSLLLALLAESGATDMRTYTIGFEHREHERGDEFEYSDRVVEAYATRHHRFRVSDRQLYERLPEAIANMAEPMLGQDCIAFYLLAEQVGRDIKVVQSGQGADEVFAGYFWYPRMQSAAGSRLERFRAHYFDRDHDEYRRTVADGLHVPDVTSPMIEASLHDDGADTFMDAVLRTDVTRLIVDDPVKRVDNMTMAWGVEARVPFLDHRLVEEAMRIPPALKLADGGKYILKKIAQDIVPKEVIDRKKGYFPVPALKFVDERLRRMMGDVLTSRACRERGLFRRDYLERLLANDDEDNLTPIRGNKLWHCALLETWLQTHLDCLSPSHLPSQARHPRESGNPA